MPDRRSQLRFFATSPLGMEGLLADELRGLGAGGVAETRAGVAFEGPLETAYLACLWSRIANRVLLPLTRFAAPDADALYHGVRQIDWSEHLTPDGTLAVDVTLAGGRQGLTHSRYTAQRVKDAIVDQFREQAGRRPGVDTAHPDVRVNVHVEREEATVSVDLSGESLHRRGYRAAGRQSEAPLKENVAAAILLRAGWPALAAGGSLVDPLCGSGTLPIEAALIAGDVAPGLLRAQAARFGFCRWRRHDEALWRRLVDEAARRRDAGLARLLTVAGVGPQVFIGYDHDEHAVALARANVARAGLEAFVRVERRELAELAPPPRTNAMPGLLVANPPYGERLGGSVAEIVSLYALLGERLRTCFTGWRAAILVGDRELGHALGLRADKLNTLYNGSLQVTLLQFTVSPDRFASAIAGRGPGPAGAAPSAAGAAGAAAPSAAPALDQFVNRLRRNLRHVGRTMRRQGITCYRLYDADLPDYAFVIDVYERWVHVQEYAAPPEIEPARARARLHDALRVIPEILGVVPADVHLKVRRRQRGSAQYDRQGTGGQFHEVQEGDLRFLVNLTDYLDTGLFLDGRLSRAMIREAAKGSTFLNLFAYTGTATVAAALGGASGTTSVDLSPTYLDWARRNLELNGCRAARNRLIEADVLDWIARPQDGRPDSPRTYDLIYLDPPTFSNSKKMGRATFDVQRDHADLIHLVTRRLLTPGGVLWFASNARRFGLDVEGLSGLVLRDLSKQMLPPDFVRSAGRHHLWQIERREDQPE